MLNLVIDGWCISSKIAHRWKSLDLGDDKSTLVQVMAWHHQVASHYLSQCWPRSVLIYGVNRPQHVNNDCGLTITYYNFLVVSITKSRTSSKLPAETSSLCPSNAIWCLRSGSTLGSFRLCNWLSLWRLVSWINHLPPACWSTFWKSNFKQQLGCRFDIMDNESYFFVFWHIQLYMSWYIRSFFGFTFLNILYFFSSTLVLTSSIDVVFILSIGSGNVFVPYSTEPLLESLWLFMLKFTKVLWYSQEIPRIWILKMCLKITHNLLSNLLRALILD